MFVVKIQALQYNVCTHIWYTRVVWKVLGLTMKNRMYNFKIIFIFQHNSLKTNTFTPAMLQRHYPVPVVVLYKICKIPLYSCNRLVIRKKKKKNADQRGRVWLLGRDKSQRGPNLGNRVDVPTIHSADPLIFPLPKHFQQNFSDHPCIVHSSSLIIQVKAWVT